MNLIVLILRQVAAAAHGSFTDHTELPHIKRYA